MQTKADREPPAPTPLDEVLSGSTLESSPWVKARIRELRLRGTKVRCWTPPVVAVACLTRRLPCSAGSPSLGGTTW